MKHYKNDPELNAEINVIVGAELATLRAEMEIWKAQQSYRYIGKDGKPIMARQLEDDRDTLRAEVERLREALKNIIDAESWILSGDDLKDIAKEALK